MDYSGRKQTISQTSFLSSDWIDSQISFNYLIAMIDENLNLHWTISFDNVVSLVGDKTVEKKK